MARFAPTIAVLALFLAGTAQATTFSDLSATPNPVALSGGSATVGFHANLGHADGVPGSCGLRLDYNDGSTPEQFLVQVGDTAANRSHVFTGAGTYPVSLRGESMLNPAGSVRPACSGAVLDTKVTILPDPSVPVITLSSLKLAPKSLTLSKGSVSATMTLNWTAPPGAGECGVKIAYSDGRTKGARIVPGANPDATVEFTQAGVQTVTVSGDTYRGSPPCKGAVSDSVTVSLANPAVVVNKGGVLDSRAKPGDALIAYAEITDVKLAGRVFLDYREGNVGTRVDIKPVIKDGKSCSYVIEEAREGYTAKNTLSYAEGDNKNPQKPLTVGWEIPDDLGHLSKGSHPALKTTGTLTVTVRGTGATPCRGKASKSISFLGRVPVPADILNGVMFEQ